MQSFAIAPAGLKPVWFILLILGAVLVPVIGVLVLSLVGSQTARFEVSPEGLRLRGDLYGRFIPADQLRGDMARRVDLATAPELQPVMRRIGTALPGYRTGWFRLRGGQKALLYLTDASRAVYIPTSNGYSLLLSPSDPDRFLSAIRSATGLK